MAGRWSTSGWGGNAHFFTATQEYDRGWTVSSLLLSPESGVDCPCPLFHANSLLSSRQLLSSGSRCQLLPASLSSQLSFASPYHFRIRRDFRFKNPLSGFAPKQTKESSALAGHPYSATTGYLRYRFFQHVFPLKYWAGLFVLNFGDQEDIGGLSLSLESSNVFFFIICISSGFYMVFFT